MRHLGVIAQLVERLNGIEEVWGSNPHGSTKCYFHEMKITVCENLMGGSNFSSTAMPRSAAFDPTDGTLQSLRIAKYHPHGSTKCLTFAVAKEKKLQ